MISKPSDSETKRQLSFLNSFERKFQMLHREIQRLERMRQGGSAFAGNWPTDGLERTAKSLIGAGAVYGLTEISKWAEGFLSSLHGIRKNSTPPSDSEMAWLNEQVAELEQLQHNAIARVEKSPAGSSSISGGDMVFSKKKVDPFADMPSAPKGGVGRRDDGSKANDSDIEANAKRAEEAKKAEAKRAEEAKKAEAKRAEEAKKAEAKKTVPRPKKKKQDEVAKQQPPLKSQRMPLKSQRMPLKSQRMPLKSQKPPSIIPDVKGSGLFAESLPHQKTAPELNVPEEEAGRDTMPVEIDDIIDATQSEVTPLPISEGKKAPPLPPPPPRRGKWPYVAAAVLAVLLGVSLFFNVFGSSGAPARETQKETSSAPVAKVASPKQKQVDLSAKDVKRNGDDSAKDKTVASSEDTDTLKQGSAGDSEGTRNTEVVSSKAASASLKKTPKTNTDTATNVTTAVKKSVIPAGPTGVLKVSLPAGANSPVTIAVDGKKRGKAPRILKLSPGLHEVTFTMDGKNSLKMVSIKEGETKEVTPKF
ncbi:MAG: hypothetical protein JXX29_23595 [Deltaproteobacteria bacterium]|nr:hypothetical protein [Deltaproteobacteria bacterium]MBN2674685.1 hypothetical protein [Deltaproteobacteria bacterium]